MEQGPLKIRLYIKPSEKTGKKIARINFFKTLEFNEGLAIIQGMFIQEKWLNHRKNHKFLSVLIYPSSILSLLSSLVALKNDSPHFLYQMEQIIKEFSFDLSGVSL